MIEVERISDEYYLAPLGDLSDEEVKNTISDLRSCAIICGSDYVGDRSTEPDSLDTSLATIGAFEGIVTGVDGHVTDGVEQ